MSIMNRIHRNPAHSDMQLSRRAFLGHYAGSLGGLALAHLLSDGVAALPASAAERTPAGPHVPARAKSVICLFQHGGPSQMDLFDPKPALAKYHGKPYPGGELEVHFTNQRGNVLASPFAFHPRGACGMELCEHLAHLGGVADDLTLVRSMNTESVDHESALRLIHTGKFLAGMPSWGSWIAYALGTENRNLPAYVVLSDPGGLPVDGERNWSAGWLPAVFQGTPFRSGRSPVLNLQTPEGTSPETRASQLRFLEQLNREHLARHPENSELEARLANFETAARMQTDVEAKHLSSEEQEQLKTLS
jgi:hypothetical protein